MCAVLAHDTVLLKSWNDLQNNLQIPFEVVADPEEAFGGLSILLPNFTAAITAVVSVSITNSINVTSNIPVTVDNNSVSVIIIISKNVQKNMYNFNLAD